MAGVILYHMEYASHSTCLILQRISQSHLRDAMRENFGNVTWLLSVLLLPLVEKVDPMVHYVLRLSQVELSNVCLPWIITWFTHDIYNPMASGRLVDAFLSGHPLLPMYFAVALLTHPLLKQDIVALIPEADDEYCEVDPATMFSVVKELPKSIVHDDYPTKRINGPGRRTRVPVFELLEDAISIMYVFEQQNFMLHCHSYMISPWNGSNILSRCVFTGNASHLGHCWI